MMTYAASEVNLSRKRGEEQMARISNRTLWVIQGLLAALFLFAGVTKLVLPVEAMTKEMPLPGAFLRFIGVAEVLGAIGLILPGLLRIRQELTALAGIGLAIIVTGATVLTLMHGGIAESLLPFVTAILCAVVVYGRTSRR